MAKSYNTYQDICRILDCTPNAAHILLKFVFEPIEHAKVWEEGAQRRRKGYESLALISEMRKHIVIWREEMGLALLNAAKPAASEVVA